LNERTHPFVRERHPNEEVHNADVTYFYVTKSGDLDYQRKTYSHHKGRNLVKMAVATTMDGFNNL